MTKVKKKEITKVLMLSPLFHELNPQEKKTVIAELRERMAVLGKFYKKRVG